MSPADRERLCRALEWEPVTWVVLYRNDADEESKIRTNKALAKVQMKTQPCAVSMEPEWPPIDTDPAWALRAMEEADHLYEVQTVLQSERRKSGWGARAVAWRAKQAHWDSQQETAPEAVCCALLAALDAGALGEGS